MGSRRKIEKLLKMVVYCEDCKIECVPTEKGILCPACGASITDEQLEDV